MEKSGEDNTSESQVPSPKPLKTYDFCPTSDEYQLMDKQMMDKLRNHVEKLDRQLESALEGKSSESKPKMSTESEVTTLLDSMIGDLSESKREDEKRINDVTFENKGHSFTDEMKTLHLKVKETKCALEEAENTAYLECPPSMNQSELNDVDSLLLELTRFNDLMNFLSEKNESVSSLEKMSTLYVQRLNKVNSIRAFRTMSRKEERETTSACGILATIVSTPFGRNHVVGEVCLANLIHSLKGFMKDELHSDACNQSKRLPLMVLFNLTFSKAGHNMISKQDGLIELLGYLVKSHNENVQTKTVAVKLLRAMVTGQENFQVFCDLEEHLPYSVIQQMSLCYCDTAIKKDLEKLMVTLEDFCGLHEF